MLGCVVLALALYAPSVRFEFAYDDVYIIQNNVLLHSLANWRTILGATWWQDAMYRPLTALSLAFDWRLAHAAPGWFHAVNALWHAAATALVFVLARSLLGRWGGAAAAAVFAVHPVHVEAVANIVGRAEVLATTLALAAVLLYRVDGALADRGVHDWRRALASLGTLGALLGALASKESAFATPALLLLTDWWDARVSGRRLGQAVRRHGVLWAAAIALTAEWLWIWFSMTAGATGGMVAPGLEGAGLVRRLTAMAPVVPEYLRLLVLPLHLSADYSPNFLVVRQSLTAGTVVGIAIVLLAVAAAWRARHRAPAMTFALAWVGAALVVVSNILAPTEVALAERTLYLASVGAVLAIAWAGAALATWRRAAGIAAVAALVAAGAVRSATRIPVWRDNATLFPQLVADAPGSFRSLWVAGGLAVQAGDTVGGERLMRRAIAVYPLHPRVWTDLAAISAARGAWGAAASYYHVAFELDSSNVEWAVQAGADFLRAGLLDSAQALIQRAYVRSPHDAQVLLAKGDLALALGRPLEAMTWRRQLAWQFPRVPGFWKLTADAALAAGDCGAVSHALIRLRALAPGDEASRDLARQATARGCRP